VIDELRTDRLVLRPLAAGDIAAFVAYRRDPRVALHQSWDETYSTADAERLVAELAGLRLGGPGGWLQLAIVEQATGRLAGDCATRLVEGPPRTAEVGVTLAAGHQGRGLAGEAVGRLVGELFDAHEIHRVIAEVDDRNTAAQRLLERLGFRLEARFVDADWFKGEWTTLLVYAMLSDEPARSRWPAGGSRKRA
jgi:RimJ/RimL family protein N-acetyltransferase